MMKKALWVVTHGVTISRTLLATCGTVARASAHTYHTLYPRRTSQCQKNPPLNARRVSVFGINNNKFSVFAKRPCQKSTVISSHRLHRLKALQYHSGWRKSQLRRVALLKKELLLHSPVLVSCWYQQQFSGAKSFLVFCFFFVFFFRESSIRFVATVNATWLTVGPSKSSWYMSTFFLRWHQWQHSESDHRFFDRYLRDPFNPW